MALSPALSRADAKLIPIGFQLYTVRGEFARDVPGTLKRLGQLGYKAVEFWAYAGTPNVYQSYSAFARGLDGLWGAYQWLDRAPKGRNEPTYWWRHHDKYENA